jgi:23S rRNA (guanine2445-N2)-methyltransferase / 23S rRNA (guanine2069-N7)-methyltransferase
VGRGRVEALVEVFDEKPVGSMRIEIPDSAGGAPHKVEVFEAATEQFAARLRKVFKERRKWASRAGVSCYRIYDSDLPDYAVAIDWYTGANDAKGNDYLHIAEYAPPASVDADKARRRFKDVLAVAPLVCGVRPDHVFSKTRIREKGGGQYRNAGQRSYVTSVLENGHSFEVDLAGRLDTGLFLDHRVTRELVGSKAEGKRFLNLFAYTGTASVYAAAGGARSTVTVDLSQTYLDWAERNMAANGFSGADHKFEKADVMRWITDARRSGRRFDLVFVDPPTFSNSKAMGKRTWDVQRDHVELLIGVSRLLSEEGEAVFSCNLRSFKPHVEDLAKYGVEIEGYPRVPFLRTSPAPPRSTNATWSGVRRPKRGFCAPPSPPSARRAAAFATRC